MSITPAWLTWDETKALVDAFSAGEIRFVGGAVRDALLGKSVQDVDVATVLRPEEVIVTLERAGIRAIPTGVAHGTVTALIGEKHFEITTLRTDVATDGRHAEVAFTDSWQEDAARRDFTMNAMYLTAEGELFDYFGGQEDAVSGRVRFIGKASARIAEDYLRILRFFRFYAHYGVSAPDEAAVAACADAAEEIGRLSGERVQAEFVKLLAAKVASKTLTLMQSYGILAATLSVEVDVSLFTKLETIEAFSHLRMPAEMKLAGLVWTAPQMLDELSMRLKLSGKTERILRLLLRNTMSVPFDMAQREQKKMLRILGAEVFVLLVLYSWAAGPIAVNAQATYVSMLALAREWVVPVFPVTGDDLVAQGFKQGKALGEVLRKLEALWEASDYTLLKPALLSKASD